MRHSLASGLIAVVVGTLVTATVAHAGSLTPSASPAATSYTLDDIYTRVTTNASAAEGSHIFAPAGVPAATLHTLKEIYDAVPTITAGLVKLGTSYLGVTGTLAPNGGTATTAAVFTGSTIHVTDDWTLDTGTLTLACATATFDATANKVADAYDGNGNGTNRWCMTDSGDAVGGDILSGKVAWVDGAEVTGTMATQTLSALNDTVTAGYYAATTLSAVDSDLAAGNIKSGTTIFGIAGNLTSYLFGDDDASRVLTTASTAGTYDASNLTAGNVKSGISYGVASTGTLAPNGGTATTAAVFTGSTIHVTDDWTLDTGTLTLACATATFDATANKVADAYDGNGNGTNRWCMTDSGDAVGGDILSGKVAWVDGAEVTGTMATQTLSALNDTVTAGYYAATTLSAVDSDLAAGNICSTATIFGIGGSATCGGGGGVSLANMWNGTGQGFTGGSQADGGVDDYNAGGSAPADRYSASWTACNGDAYDAATNPGGNWCNTGDSGAAYKDENTGLIWSKTMNSSTYALDDSAGTMTWFIANNCTESSGSACTKKTSAKTGCEATAGWSLPNQKQLMQAYIDGCYGNLESSTPVRYFWSATTVSDNTDTAWSFPLAYSLMFRTLKTTSSNRYVRCVRS